MAHSYHFWLEYPADWRALRDFLYEACKCTHFWTGPMTAQEGPPDNQPRDHYGVRNRYNLIDLRQPLVVKSPYIHDLHVHFTFNKAAPFEQWQNEVLDACVRWLARSTGDALLDWDSVPILGRKGEVIIVNDLIYDDLTDRELHARRPEYQAFIAMTLEREGLAYKVGSLDPIDMTPTRPTDELRE